MYKNILSLYVAPSSFSKCFGGFFKFKMFNLRVVFYGVFVNCLVCVQRRERFQTGSGRRRLRSEW